MIPRSVLYGCLSKEAVEKCVERARAVKHVMDLDISSEKAKGWNILVTKEIYLNLSSHCQYGRGYRH